MSNKKVNEATGNVKISSPWISYLHKIQVLFADDPDIKLVYDPENIRITMHITGTDKYDALSKLLPDKVEFGNVVLNLDVVPSNAPISKSDLIERAFRGNPLYKCAYEIQPQGCSNSLTYVLFAKEVVQYWDDNLGDPHGRVSTLAQEIAKDILVNDEGVYYATDTDW